ncbi:MAG: helix-turn-helix domain-containing protein [Rickettsiales bacterium]|nr:helix-turn-helix domain-containing protein [Rickettsiales bacterium]
MTTLLTTIEAAHYLSVSAQTMKNWRSLGKPPSYIKLQNEKMVRYRQGDLDSFIEQLELMNVEGDV